MLAISKAITVADLITIWEMEQQARIDESDDRVVTTSSPLLGLTIGCARCHDHKFDLVSQNDDYRTNPLLTRSA